MILWINILATIGGLFLYVLISFISARLINFLLRSKPDYRTEWSFYFFGGLICLPVLIFLLIIFPIIMILRLELRVLELEKKVLFKNKKNAKRRKNA